MTYFRAGKPRTIIGAEQFHFRVRNGVGWYPLAMAARQTGHSLSVRLKLHARSRAGIDAALSFLPLVTSYYSPKDRNLESDLGVRVITATPRLFGCYMVKPHGQLVLVSFMHYCTSTSSLSTS